jgi:hypothetical protein
MVFYNLSKLSLFAYLVFLNIFLGFWVLDPNTNVMGVFSLKLLAIGVEHLSEVLRLLEYVLIQMYTHDFQVIDAFYNKYLHSICK